MTIDSTQAIGFWQRWKLQQITTVAGLAIALGAAVALGGWQGESPRPAGQAATREASPRVKLLLREFNSARYDRAELVYYLVSSEDQADFALYIEHEAVRALSSTEAPPRRDVRTIIVTTAEEGYEAETFLRAVSSDIGPNILLRVVDLR